MTARYPRLYAIADGDFWGLPRLVNLVSTMAEAGVGWIQLRCKTATDRQRFDLVESCCRGIEGSGTALWINDRVDLAALFPVFGAHLGQDDLPPAAARAVLGARTQLGRSTHSLEQVAVAEGDAAVDVVAFGPIFATRSKRQADPELGLEALRQARAATRKWLVAIGGLEGDRIGSALAAGADAVAVISALGSPTGLARRCRTLLAQAA